MQDLDPKLRYDMPAAFGPSPVPDRTVINDARCLILSFETTRETALAMVPDHFGVPDRPRISVAHVAYRNVDYLGGRDYNEVVVTVSARFEGSNDSIDAAFAPILWVNQTGALLAGRDYMGLAKLNANIPDVAKDGDHLRFTSAEYSEAMLAGEAWDLRSLAADKLEGVNKTAACVNTFGWKYIPSAGGGADVDLPILNVMRWNYTSVAVGAGKIEFYPLDLKAAPLSFQALRHLANLPQVSEVRALHGEGSAVVDRSATRRLWR